MIKHFLFLSKTEIDKEKFELLIKNTCKSDSISYFDSFSGDIIASSDQYVLLDLKIREISEKLGIRISILASHDASDFSLQLLKESLTYYPNQVSYPSDIIMKELSFGDYRSYSSIRAMFSNIDRDILETVGTYLRCGLDGLFAAKRLGIHRNTFNYRINKFIDITSLDIRDYHNALLLELYFQLIS